MTLMKTDNTDKKGNEEGEERGEYMYGADKTQMKKIGRKPSEARIGERRFERRVEKRVV
jgi:hypothetical protein